MFDKLNLLTGGPDETAGFGVAVKAGLRRFGKTDEPSSSERAPVSKFDYDPERALWKPNRRAFFFGLGAALVGTMLPDVPIPSALKAATGWESTSLVVGDTFTIHGVYAVNPKGFLSLDLETFVVTGFSNGVATISPNSRIAQPKVRI